MLTSALMNNMLSIDTNLLFHAVAADRPEHRPALAGVAYRRIYDARLALTLRQHGVTEFATTNTRDFDGFGFTRVFNPLSEGGTRSA